MYRNKLIALLALVGVLALTYVGSLVFDPERMAKRSESFSLLGEKAAAAALRIEISNASDRTVLANNEGRWTAIRDGVAYPARAGRIGDLLSALSSRAAYPRRSSTSSAHAALGLTTSAASRIAVFGSGDKPLLDLLVGNADAAGKNIALRFAGNDESFAGLDRFSSYLTGGARAWLDLALFASDPISSETIQRITMTRDLPEGKSAYTLTRDAERGWRIEGKSSQVDARKADAYAKTLATAEADDFVGISDGTMKAAATIIIETGDGRSRSVEIGRAGAKDSSDASVSGSAFKFSLGSWNVERLVRDESYFLSTP